jgi:hypothetical protein
MNKYQDKDYQARFAKDWFGLAHGAGALGSVVFIGICYYEFGILMRLWGSPLKAVLVPVLLELAQWFLSKMAARQRVYDEQQAQLHLLESHLAEYRKTEKNEAVIQEEAKGFIAQCNLNILRGATVITSSGIDSRLIYVLAFVPMAISTWIIMGNRQDSNEKGIQLQIAAEVRKLDSIAKLDIETHIENRDAKIQTIIASGTVDNENAIRLNTRIEELNKEIAEAREKKEVNKKAKLDKERKALRSELNKMPVSAEITEAKAGVNEEYTGWKLKYDEDLKAKKQGIADDIRNRHVSKGQQINWMAILTNLTYFAFNYVIVKMRTLTGLWSFDLIELIVTLVGSLLKSLMPKTEPILKTNTDTEGVSKEKVKVEVMGPINEVSQNEQTQNVDEALPQAAKQPTVVIPQKPTIAKLSKANPVSDVVKVGNLQYHYVKFTEGDMQRFMDEKGISDIDGCQDANQVWCRIKNGRKAMIEGKTGSKSIEAMTTILAVLKSKYEIEIDPDTIDQNKPTPKMRRRIIKNLANHQ